MSITRCTILCLGSALCLAGCGSPYNTKTTLPPNCAEQSQLATAGTQDGRYIAITCPNGSYAAPAMAGGYIPDAQGYIAY